MLLVGRSGLRTLNCRPPGELSAMDSRVLCSRGDPGCLEYGLRIALMIEDAIGVKNTLAKAFGRSGWNLIPDEDIGTPQGRLTYIIRFTRWQHQLGAL